MNSSGSLFFWAAAIFAALLLFGLLSSLTRSRAKFVKKRFLTEAEARVLSYLEAALPGHRIMAQVSMGALLQSGESDRRAAQSTRNHFTQKIVDFVVVTRDTAEVVALVELDDRTHRADKDRKRDAMTASAGYRTIRLPSGRKPTAQIVRTAVAELAAPSLNIGTSNINDHGSAN